MTEDKRDVALEVDEQPPGEWVETCDILSGPTPEELKQGELLGKTISVDNDEDAGPRMLTLLRSDRDAALVKARALKRVMLDHGVPQVSIELQAGRPNSYGVYDALYCVDEMSHHTVSRFGANLTPVLALCKNGRDDLPGPLCNGYGGYDLTYRIITFGYANHPGAGGPLTIPAYSGGTYTIPKDSARRYAWGTEWEGGVQEVDWDRLLTNPRTDDQMTMREFMGRSNAALREFHKIAHHSEHSTWTSRKIDRLGYTSAKGTTELLRYKKKDEEPPILLTFQHTSMQFGDSDRQMAADVDRIFSRGKQILTGTEAGGAKALPLPDLLAAAAKEHGYRFHNVRGTWLAVKRDLITGNWDTGYVPVLESTDGVGKHTDRGITWATFDTKGIGRVSIGCGHYLTKGRKPGDPNYTENTKYAKAIGAWAREHGAGAGLAFYAGDQNIVDRTDDTFHGEPLTSAWDALEKWQDTGHGNIDVIASYDKDARVEWKSIRALNDTKFPLHTDHFLVEAVAKIKPAKR